MTTIKNILLIISLLTSTLAFSGTEILCKVRYFHKIYHPPVPPFYYEGSEIGKVPILETGRAGYYEDVWSSTYTLKVKFFSGYELNQHYNNSFFNDNAIVALVTWGNGGYTFIVIKGWFTKLEVMTEDEIKFNTKGERISYMTGYDNESRFWEFYY